MAEDRTRNYVVIENVSGYLPHDDDPPTFDSYAEAVRYVNDYYQERLSEVDGDDPGISMYKLTPIVNGSFYYKFANDPYDLGRVVSIEPLED